MSTKYCKCTLDIAIIVAARCTYGSIIAPPEALMSALLTAWGIVPEPVCVCVCALHPFVGVQKHDFVEQVFIYNVCLYAVTHLLYTYL